MLRIFHFLNINLELMFIFKNVAKVWFTRDIKDLIAMNFAVCQRLSVGKDEVSLLKHPKYFICVELLGVRSELQDIYHKSMSCSRRYHFSLGEACIGASLVHL